MTRLLTSCGLLLAAVVAPARGDVLWDEGPYRVAVVIDAAASGLSSDDQRALEAGLRDRISWRLAGFWRLVESDHQDGLDKRYDLRVAAAGPGFRIDASERDLLVATVAAPVATEVPSAADLPERLYATTLRAFRPVARFLRDPSASDRVTLTYRAGAVAPAGVPHRAAEGVVLLPYRRSSDRQGVPSPASPIPWTYLTALATESGADAPKALVTSHSRRPFGSRSASRAELLAVAASADSGRSTTLRLHALGDPETPLPGYEVSLGDPGSTTLRSLGATDRTGRVTLPPSERVMMAHVRCGELVVASLPVVAGASDEIEVGLVDERSRLRAELDMTSLREDLIDTVARRKILAERIRRLIDAGSVGAAAKLLGELEALPGRTLFERRLDAARRSLKATHPIGQARLDRVFEKTARVLSGALDPREPRDLAILVERARRDAELRPDGASPAEEAPQGG